MSPIGTDFTQDPDFDILSKGSYCSTGYDIETRKPVTRVARDIFPIETNVPCFKRVSYYPTDNEACGPQTKADLGLVSVGENDSSLQNELSFHLTNYFGDYADDIENSSEALDKNLFGLEESSSEKSKSITPNLSGLEKCSSEKSKSAIPNLSGLEESSGEKSKSITPVIRYSLPKKGIHIVNPKDKFKRKDFGNVKFTLQPWDIKGLPKTMDPPKLQRPKKKAVPFKQSQRSRHVLKEKQYKKPIIILSDNQCKKAIFEPIQENKSIDVDNIQLGKTTVNTTSGNENVPGNEKVAGNEKDILESHQKDQTIQENKYIHVYDAQLRKTTANVTSGHEDVAGNEDVVSDNKSIIDMAGNFSSDPEILGHQLESLLDVVVKQIRGKDHNLFML